MRYFIIVIAIFINLSVYGIPNHPLPMPEEPAQSQFHINVPEEVHYIDETKYLMSRLNFTTNTMMNLNKLISADVRNKIPTLWPVQGGGIITSPFGPRYSPFSAAREWHPGIDIAFGPGVPILAAADGIVTNAETNRGYGVLVIIDHVYGFSTFYGHLMRSSVKNGDIVQKGQIIGYMGSTGRSSGVHLHFEVRINSVIVDPRWFMFIRSF